MNRLAVSRFGWRSSFPGNLYRFLIPKSLLHEAQRQQFLRLLSFQRSGYRPQCFRSAALAGGYSDVTLPSVQTRNEKKKTMRKRQEGQRQQWTD
eukprot:908912-Pelagomonas_calceolata.AAC.1